MNRTIAEGFDGDHAHLACMPTTFHVYAGNNNDVVYGWPSPLRHPMTTEEARRAFAVLYRIRVFPKRQVYQ